MVDGTNQSEGVAAKEDTTGKDPANPGNGPADTGSGEQTNAEPTARETAQAEEIITLKGTITDLENSNAALEADRASFANRAADAEAERDAAKASLAEANAHIAAMATPATPQPATPAPTEIVHESPEHEASYVAAELEVLVEIVRSKVQRLNDLLHHPSRIPLFEKIEQAIKNAADALLPAKKVADDAKEAFEKAKAEAAAAAEKVAE